MTNIKSASLDDIKKMKARGEIKPPAKDAPTFDLPDGFWDNAEVRKPLISDKPKGTQEIESNFTFGSSSTFVSKMRRIDFVRMIDKPVTSWRERLADWISRGAISTERKWAQIVYEEDRKAKEKLGADLIQARWSQSTSETFADEATLEANAAKKALQDIIDMETPGAAHIGKKMAARAREAV